MSNCVATVVAKPSGRFWLLKKLSGMPPVGRRLLMMLF